MTGPRCLGAEVAIGPKCLYTQGPVQFYNVSYPPYLSDWQIRGGGVRHNVELDWTLWHKAPGGLLTLYRKNSC